MWTTKTRDYEVSLAKGPLRRGKHEFRKQRVILQVLTSGNPLLKNFSTKNNIKKVLTCCKLIIVNDCSRHLVLNIDSKMSSTFTRFLFNQMFMCILKLFFVD